MITGDIVQEKAEITKIHWMHGSTENSNLSLWD